MYLLSYVAKNAVNIWESIWLYVIFVRLNFIFFKKISLIQICFCKKVHYVKVFAFSTLITLNLRMKKSVFKCATTNWTGLRSLARRIGWSFYVSHPSWQLNYSKQIKKIKINASLIFWLQSQDFNNRRITVCSTWSVVVFNASKPNKKTP